MVAIARTTDAIAKHKVYLLSVFFVLKYGRDWRVAGRRVRRGNIHRLNSLRKVYSRTFKDLLAAFFA